MDKTELSNRRRSARCNNATVMQEQQTLQKALKRKVASRSAEGAFAHNVLSDEFCGPIWESYARYLERSPLLDTSAEDTSPEGAGGGRTLRRRGGNRSSMGGSGDGAAAGGPPELGGAAALAQALAPSEALAEKEAARAWEQTGHQCLDLTEPLMAGGTIMLSRDLQEALMHLVLNAEVHRTHLSARALVLLQRMLTAHPPVVQIGDTMVENADLWEPVGGRWQARPHQSLPALTRLGQGKGIIELVASAHNWVAREAEAAAGSTVPRAEGPRPQGSLGDVLLLQYWVRILKADAAVRLAAARASGFNPALRGQLENSLLVNFTRMTPWRDMSRCLPQVVRQLAFTIVLSYIATQSGAHPEAAAAAASPSTAPGGGRAPAAALPRPLLLAPGEVGQVAADLLGLMYDVYDALNRMGAYRRQGSVSLTNDLVKLDQELLRALDKEPLLRHSEGAGALMARLPPHAGVRLVVAMVAAAGYKRDQEGRLVGGRLRAVAQYYEADGTEAPPEMLASDVLSYLLGDKAVEGTPLKKPRTGAAPQTDWAASGGSGGGSLANLDWALGFVRSRGLLGAAGVGLMVLLLVGGVMQHVEQLRRQQRQAAAGGAGREGEGRATAVEAAEVEAETVAGLYERLAGVLEPRGLLGGTEEAGVWLAAKRRCVERLAGRVRAGGRRVDMQAYR